MGPSKIQQQLMPQMFSSLFLDRVEKKERARLKTVKFNSKTRGDKGVSVDTDTASLAFFSFLLCQS